METHDATDNEPLWGLSLSEPAGPADHVDELLSTLLDLSDDICRAVTWLAEHWSLDLPRLAWTAGSEHLGHVVRLVAACRDRAQLDHVAELLDTTIDVEVHTERRWIHARRPFGLVMVDVFHSEPVDDAAARYLTAYQAKCDEGPEAGAA